MGRVKIMKSGAIPSWVNVGVWAEKKILTVGKVFAHLTSMGLIIMILMGTIDVVGSKLFNAPLPVTFEATEALVVGLVFGGLAYAQQQKRHVKVDLVIRRFSPKVQKISALLGLLFGIVYFGTLTWRCALLFWESFKIREFAEALYPFPIYPTKFVMLFGAGLVTIQLIVDLFRIGRANDCGKPDAKKSLSAVEREIS